ncbi:MAG: hypothetical protein HZC42_15135 [Candidatus Eisenbacteria bacterium]|nr:hypothetical protein [Candidatus Eisenbacteria bacterium]
MEARRRSARLGHSAHGSMPSRVHGVPAMRPSSTSTSDMHPHKPRLVFRVGIVGHRPNRLPPGDRSALSFRLGEVLTVIREQVEAFGRGHAGLFAHGAPVLRAISPLAEGTDRLFAEAALGLGYQLCCPMPFRQAEFEQDFAPPAALEPDSLARFRDLLARAEKETRLTRFELDGKRKPEGEAYGACGRVVLNQSDLLVVVWDGERLGRPGGTEETFAEARHRGLPVVWIDARAPHAWQLVEASTTLPGQQKGERAVPVLDDIKNLRAVVQDALDLPRLPEKSGGPEAEEHEARKHEKAKEHWGRQITIEEYYAERKPRLNPAVLWKFFRDLVSDGRWSFAGFDVPDFEQAVEKEWPRNDSTPLARVVNGLRPFYAWPDKLAVFYSDAYRSTFVLAYLLSAAAVGMALLPLAAGWIGHHHHTAEVVCIVSELVMILTIVTLVLRGRRHGWHERWIDYRLGAELVRHLRLVVPLGGGRPFPQVPAHWAAYGHPGATWVAWYVRAVERDLGLPSAVVDEAHVKACLEHVAELLSGQVDFHETNAGRCHRIDGRLHRMGMILLVLTLAACGANFLRNCAAAWMLPAWVSWNLTFLCGFLPALGAALVGINNQGEFRRLTRRSEAMKEHLKDLRASVEKLQQELASPPAGGSQPASVRASALCTQAAQLMVNEVLDWRVVFLDRPLTSPA